MPCWKECHIVAGHPRFIARLLDGLTDARLGGTDFLTRLRNAEIVNGRRFACTRDR